VRKAHLQPRALQRGRLALAARLAGLDVAQALAIRDEHAHRGHGLEHRGRVAPRRGTPRLREREALEVARDVAERLRRVELLLHGDEAHVEPERDRLRLLLPAAEAREDVRLDAEVRAVEQRRVAGAYAHLALRVAGVLERSYRAPIIIPLLVLPKVTTTCIGTPWESRFSRGRERAMS
jgi:hypothetical protein